MVTDNRPVKNFGKTAYWCHVSLAVIVCLALAMQIHLTVIQASGEVVGAGAFLLIMWLGIPALALTFFAIVNSVKASDKQLLLLAVVLVILIIAVVLSTPLVLVIALAATYVALVVRLGFIRSRNRSRGAVS